MPSNLIGEQRLDEESDEEDFYDATELLDDAEKDEKEEMLAENTDLSGGHESNKHSDINNCGLTTNITYEKNTGEKEYNKEDTIEEDLDDGEDDDDDDEGWITPANISDVKRSMGLDTVSSSHVSVGCLTTDFAMQVCKDVLF